LFAQETSFKLQINILEALRIIFEDNPTQKNKETLRKNLNAIRIQQKRSNEELLYKTFDFLEWIENKRSEEKGKWS
jgi:hypothetical protein